MSTQRRVGLAVMLWCAIAVAARGSEGDRVDVGISPVERRVYDDAARQGNVSEARVATFHNAPTSYGIRYTVQHDRQGKIVPGEGYLGMPLPSTCNWYHGGFLFLSLNGKDIGTRTAASGMYVAESGRRGLADLVWRDPAAVVRARFVGLPGRDWLGCQIVLEPTGKIESLGLRLLCFPSYFTSHHHRVGARRIRTGTDLVLEGKSARPSPADHWWAVYHDEVFDVAKGEGEGPCGMLVDPAVVDSIEYRPGGYAVDTRIAVRPDTRELRLAFWDFHGRPNAEVLAEFPAAADAARRELAALDFTPASLRNLDLNKLRGEVARAMGMPGVRKQLGRTAAEIDTWLAAEADAAPAGQPGGIVAEQKRLEYVGRYEAFRWQLRLAELCESL